MVKYVAMTFFMLSLTSAPALCIKACCFFCCFFGGAMIEVCSLDIFLWLETKGVQIIMNIRRLQLSFLSCLSIHVFLYWVLFESSNNILTYVRDFQNKHT